MTSNELIRMYVLSQRIVWGSAVITKTASHVLVVIAV